MDRFHELQVFVAVAEAGGFSKAAARLRSSPPAVTRAVASLEDRLGARLFNRTTRRLSVTETGPAETVPDTLVLVPASTAGPRLAGAEPVHERPIP